MERVRLGIAWYVTVGRGLAGTARSDMFRSGLVRRGVVGYVRQVMVWQARCDMVWVGKVRLDMTRCGRHGKTRRAVVRQELV